MEVALHLRDAEDGLELPSVEEHLRELYRRLAPECERETAFPGDALEGIPLPPPGRLYTGDEFCVHRLPTVREMERFCQGSQRNGWSVTLLTPPVTDEEMGACGKLLDVLRSHDPASEVVVNDWGMLCFVKERYPLFSVNAGRVLHKGFKDPRLKDFGEIARLSLEARELLETGTFDQPLFRKMLSRYGVSRLERDMMPYGEPTIPEDMEGSYYFPFGYVTAGRVCWTASFHENGGRFVPRRSCPRFCKGWNMQLQSPDLDYRIFCMGNTVYYLYTFSMLGLLFRHAAKYRQRLIYQGAGS